METPTHVPAPADAFMRLRLRHRAGLVLRTCDHGARHARRSRCCQIANRESSSGVLLAAAPKQSFGPRPKSPRNLGGNYRRFPLGPLLTTRSHSRGNKSPHAARVGRLYAVRHAAAAAAISEAHGRPRRRCDARQIRRQVRRPRQRESRLDDRAERPFDDPRE